MAVDELGPVAEEHPAPAVRAQLLQRPTGTGVHNLPKHVPSRNPISRRTLVQQKPPRRGQNVVQVVLVDDGCAVHGGGQVPAGQPFNRQKAQHRLHRQEGGVLIDVVGDGGVQGEGLGVPDQIADQMSLKEFVDPFTGSKNTKA